MKTDSTFYTYNTLWNFFTEEYQKLRTESPDANLPDLVQEALVPAVTAASEFLRTVQALEALLKANPFQSEKGETDAAKS